MIMVENTLSLEGKRLTLHVRSRRAISKWKTFRTDQDLGFMFIYIMVAQIHNSAVAIAPENNQA